MQAVIRSHKINAKRFRDTYHEYPKPGDSQGMRFDAYFDPQGQLSISIPIDGRAYEIHLSEEDSKQFIKRLFKDTGDRAMRLVGPEMQLEILKKLQPFQTERK